ncbi:MAG: type II secretion system protein [Solobacterium sp.]|nr:type II secretion system protein [Solobacterium sp.]
MKKINNKKGFTLAELLIVVAIIAVLVAIAIPVFTSQLEKAREATDAANIRSAYAEVVAEALTQSGEEEEITRTVELKQQQDGWQTEGQEANLAGTGLISGGDHVDPTINGTPSAGGTATITYTPAEGDTDATIVIAFE